MVDVCGLVQGLGCPTCEDLQAKAGLAKNIYVGRLSDLDPANPFDIEEDGSISGINLIYDRYLVKLCAKDKSANYTQAQVNSDNGLKLRLPVIQGLFQQQGQVPKNVWDGMKTATDLFVVVENNYGGFEIFFTESGGEITASDKPSGVNFGDANSFNITFSQIEAGESGFAPDFLDTDYQTTKELLESYLM